MNGIQTSKKIVLTAILAVLFILAVGVCIDRKPAGVHALGSYGGDGTADSPYILSDANDITAFMNDVNNKTAPDGFINTYFVFSNHIDLTDVSLAPIGDFTYPFKGNLNGNGYSLTGLDIFGTNENTGLFGVISPDALIENLTVEGNIKGESNVAAFVGTNNGIIRNCFNLSAVRGGTDISCINIGGIAGHNNGTVSGCGNHGNIYSNGTNAGGIVGSNFSDGVTEGEIIDCYNAGTVESTYNVAGGIAGSNNSYISGCFNASNISAYDTLGGICGINNGTIENAYNTGTIEASNHIAGGIAGSNEGDIRNSFNGSDIIAKNLKGAISGYFSSGSIDSCFFSTDKFNGKMTHRGNDYPNSKPLRDVDMTSSDALTSSAKMQKLSEGRGNGAWTKRAFDESNCYYPELGFYSYNGSENVRSKSQESARLERVAPANITLEAVEYVYSGESNEPGIMLGDELLSRGVDYNVVYANNLNAGEENFASAEITFINYYKGVLTKNFTVKKKAVSLVWSDEVFYYNGAVQHHTASVASGQVGDEIITFEYDFLGNIDAGEHNVTAKLADTAVNSNYVIEGETKHTYTILKAPFTVGLKSETLVYNGTAQHPSGKALSGVIDGETVELMYSGYENNIGAGNYTVFIALAEAAVNRNYGFEKTGYNYTIHRQKLEIEPATTELIYNGTAQHITATIKSGLIGDDNVTFEYANFEDHIDAGINYNVSVSLSDTAVNKNYYIETTRLTYDIGKKEIGLIWSETILTYSGRAQMPPYTIDGLIGEDTVSLTVSDFSRNIDANNNYRVDISLTNADNYMMTAVSRDYEILPMAVTVRWAEDGELVYNGKAQRPTVKVMTDTPDRVLLEVEPLQSVNTGTYYPSVISVNSNYRVSNSLSFEIIPKTLSVMWGNDKLIYNGSAQRLTADIAGILPGEAVGFRYSDYHKNIKAGVKYRISVILDADVKNYVLDENTAEAVYEIGRKSISISEITAESRAYDGTNKVSLSGGKLDDIIAGDKVSFERNTALTDRPDAGEHAVVTNIALKGEDAGNYVLIQPRLTVTIRKAKLDIGGLSIASKTFAYDGEVKELKVEGNLPAGVSVHYINNRQIEIGSYRVIVNFIDATGNYITEETLEAALHIAQSRFKDEDRKVEVEVAEGYVDFDSSLQIKSAENHPKLKNKDLVFAYDITFFKDNAEVQPNGKLKIAVSLDKFRYKNNLYFYHYEGETYYEIPYVIEDNNLIFYTDSLSVFALYEQQTGLLFLWITMGVIAILLLGVTTIFLIKCRKRIDISKRNRLAATTIIDLPESDGPEADQHEEPSEPIADTAFYLDGVYCKSFDSFLAALCYKTPFRQLETAQLPAAKAKANAMGKSGLKRTDFYWKSKKIVKDSKEYRALIGRAKIAQEEQSKKDL